MFKTNRSIKLENGTIVQDYLPSFTAQNILLAVMENCSLQFRLFVSYFGDLSLLMSVLSLYLPLAQFTSMIYAETMVIVKNKSGGNNFTMVQSDLSRYVKKEVEDKIDRFLALKTLSKLIGNAVGELIVPFFVEALFYYSRSFHTLILSHDSGKRYRLLFHFVTTLIIILISAEIIRKVILKCDFDM